MSELYPGQVGPRVIQRLIVRGVSTEIWAASRRFRKENLPAEKSVYFIESGIRGPIKIGIAKDPVARLKGLQIGSAERMRLLGQIPPTAFAGSVEHYLHIQFAMDQLHGEWFKRTSLLEAVIKDLCSVSIADQEQVTA